MKIGVLGTGEVGQTLGEGFAKLGHRVMIGSRDPSKKEVQEWLAKTKAEAGSFAGAAAFGELIVLATRWEKGATENAIKLAGKENFTGKIVIDVTNPLDFSAGAPKLDVAYPDSAGARVQKWLPQAKVVKAFNIITASYMTNPHLAEGKPDLFIAGNDGAAKKTVKEIAMKFGWENVHDMGSIEQSYLLEALAMLWVRYGFLNDHWTHGFKLLKK
ncbi:MAG: NAD(P)-binding domain-containing protein [Candidatus Aenigmarchaeota archaeon]|nr:NAD(P)-binding domain-containing protein [Candidatus Aenigmarchaeota archaeon]